MWLFCVYNWVDNNDTDKFLSVAKLLNHITMPNRRKFLLQSGATAGFVSFAGCINVPDGGGSGEADADGDGNGDDDGSGSQPVELTAEDVLFNQIDSVVDFTSWVSNRYGTDYVAYRDAMDEVLEYIEMLRDMPFEDVDQEEVESLVELVDEINVVVDQRFRPYYDRHYDWDSDIQKVDSSVRNSVNRREEGDFNDLLDELERTISRRRVRISSSYPRYRIGYSVFERFFKDESSVDDGFIFEVADLSGSPSGFLSTTFHDTSVFQKPFGLDLHEEFAARRGADRETDVLDYIEFVSRPQEAEEQIFVNMADYSLVDGSYPDSYIFEEAGVGVSQVETANLNLADPVGVYIQQFSDAETVSSIADSIRDQGEIDGQTEYGGIEYDRVFAVGNGDTYYVYLAEVRDYLIALDPTTTQWENRNVTYQEDGQSQNISVEEFIDPLFVVPNDADVED